MRELQILTRRAVESLIANGDIIVIAEGNVLRLNGWKNKHPGGELVLRHMIGRDATDEINISHRPATLKNMHCYAIGRIEGEWQNFIPPIQGGVFRVADAEELAACEQASSHQQTPTVNGALNNSTDVRLRSRSSSPTPDDIVDVLAPYVSLAASPAKTLSAQDYINGRIQHEIDADLDKYPPLDAATQRDIAIKFRALHERVENEGYYDCPLSEYGKEMIRYTALFATFIFCLNRGWYFVSACFLGLFWHQIMFTAHDAGHRGITSNFTADTLIGIFIADFCCGLSIGWWKSSHNVHHLVTNSPEHDPDIQNVPLFSTSPEFFNSIKSSYYGGFIFPWDAFAAIAVTVQKYTYYPIMAVARFNLYLLSWGFLLSAKSRTQGRTWWTRPTEIVGISTYFFMYFYVLLWRNVPTWQARAIFLLTSHLITMPLHVQITLSHWGTSTADLGPKESFAQKQLRTTMDVSCPQWLDFIHGGLQFQAVHHLFPRVPRHNLRRLQCLVREFCAETGIEYLIHDFVAGNGKVLGRLQDLADQAKILAACQSHMAATGESGLH